MLHSVRIEPPNENLDRMGTKYYFIWGKSTVCKGVGLTFTLTQVMIRSYQPWGEERERLKRLIEIRILTAVEILKELEKAHRLLPPHREELNVVNSN